MNQNPALLALGILFYRWHNVQAFIVQAQHPDWADEDVFQVHAVCFIRDTFIRDIVRILKKERDKPLSFLIF